MYSVYVGITIIPNVFDEDMWMFHLDAAVVAADSHRDKLNARGTVGGLEVAHLDSAAAITLHDPEYVVMCWQPSGVDWTLHC